MTEELVKKAKKLIEKILYITIATSNKNNEPWNTPVYCAYDENYSFYWYSWKENIHSKNIVENENVFIVIYDSTVPEGTGFAVYMQGKASKLEEDDILEVEKGIKLCHSRKNKEPRATKEYLGEYPRRVFKFVPKKVWVNSKDFIGKNYVDTRVDITKEILGMSEML